MTVFEPMGRVRFGHVPFDNTYTDDVWFADPQAQHDFLMSCMDERLTRDDFTYIRLNSAIRYPANAETMYDVNYCIYQNANYSGKWFYAFVTNVTYVNQEVCELALQTDVIATWREELELHDVFVEREHVSDDGIGANLVPEPDMSVLHITGDRYSDGDFNDCYVIVQTNAVPVSEERPVLDLFNPTSSVSVEGGDYHNVMSGGKYFAFSTFSDAAQFLRSLNQAGAADSVSACFLFPKFYCPNVGSDYGVATDTDVAARSRFVNLPDDLDGYTPRNNKMYTYPYTYVRFDDNNGHSAEYRFEFWEPQSTSEGSGYKYTVSMALDPDSSVFVVPQDYNGVGNNVTEAFTFPFGVRCSWVYSAYETWLAQNSLASAINSSIVNVDDFLSGGGLGGVVDALSSGISGLGDAISDVSPTVGGAVKSAGSTALGWLTGGTHSQGLQSDDARSVLSLLSAAGVAGTQDYYRMSKTPNVQKAGTAGNGLYAEGFMTYNCAVITPRREFAVIIDGFFHLYGYQVDRVKAVELTSRERWNYVKTRAADFGGRIPQDALATINAIFNNGIRLWHVADIGSYDVDNPIV